MAYSRAFFEQQREGSLTSAREVVPLIIELIQPRSVVDVGCGVGTWLKVFMERGVTDTLGVDGAYARASGLLIPETHFLATDLSAPLDVGRRFDVAMSLEVGEHLPASSASVLVTSLVRLAPVVVFSAAVPFQGGTNHINEQWPGYWASLFDGQRDVAIDAIRPSTWMNENIEVWYRQNMLVFADRAVVDRNPALAAAHARTSRDMLAVVHPHLFMTRNSYPLGSWSGLGTWWVRRGLSAIERAVRGRR